GNPFGIPTFPQPQQQQAFSGYISNGSTGIARVTFLDGLTRDTPEKIEVVLLSEAKDPKPLDFGMIRLARMPKKS
ncbi:MAG: hypothetical protein WBQ89_28500, partial [Candidatus Acidiferrum sp.]